MVCFIGRSDPGDEDDPVTMNGYTYGDNNPVMKVDPDGHYAIALVPQELTFGIQLAGLLLEGLQFTGVSSI